MTVADLAPSFRAKPPVQPKFFHFMDTKTAKEFHEATLITFTGNDGKEVVLKDSFNRRTA